MSVDTIRAMSQNARSAGLLLSSSSIGQRNLALNAVAESIRTHLPEIFSANELDLQAATEEKLSAPLLTRLKFGDDKALRVIEGLTALAERPTGWCNIVAQHPEGRVRAS